MQASDNFIIAYKFLKRQIRWSGIPVSFRIFQFVVIHIVKGFGIVNKAEVYIYWELSCFFDDPTDVGNLISGPCGGDGDRVMALESREGTRASRRVEEGLSRFFRGAAGNPHFPLDCFCDSLLLT